jgi:hypothetical protein
MKSSHQYQVATLPNVLPYYRLKNEMWRRGLLGKANRCTMTAQIAKLRAAYYGYGRSALGN